MSAWKAIEGRLRHGVARVLLLPLGSASVPPYRVRLDEVRRVLFVRPNFRLGNLLLTTPALSTARRGLPWAEIDLLTTSSYWDLLRGHPDVDGIARFDRPMLLHPWALAGLIRRLRERRYDLVVDCSEGESLTGALLARLSGGRWRVAPRSGRYRALFNVHVPPDARHDHRVERLLHVLKGIGIAGERRGMSIALDASEREWAAERWREWGLPDGGLVIGVNIGARGEKRWPMESFLRLVQRLAEERDVRSVVFAGPEDLDRLALVEDRLPEDAVVARTARVQRFAALLERCSVVVTGDTGPMHLAAAVGTPTVSIFLQDNDAVFAPLGASHRCVRRDGGGPTPGEVVLAVREAMARIGRPRPATAASAVPFRSPPQDLAR